MTDPLDDAKARLARGEIDTGEYDRIAKRLDKPAASGSGRFLLFLVLTLAGIGIVGFGIVLAGTSMMSQMSGVVIVAIAALVVVIVLFLLYMYHEGF